MTRRIPAAIRERWEDRSPALESLTLEQYVAMVERSKGRATAIQREPYCRDCGQHGYSTGHQECPYPSDH
jgi:hypothetical protein